MHVDGMAMLVELSELLNLISTTIDEYAVSFGKVFSPETSYCFYC